MPIYFLAIFFDQQIVDIFVSKNQADSYICQLQFSQNKYIIKKLANYFLPCKQDLTI